MEQTNVKSDNHKAHNSIFGNVWFASLSRLVHLIWHHRRGKCKLKQDENNQPKKILGHSIKDFNKQLRRNQATNTQRARKSDVKKTSLTQDTPQRRRKV